MPFAAGSALSQFVQTYGRCTTMKRSCNAYEQAGYVAGAAIGQVQPVGVLNDLITIPTDISFGNIIQPLLVQLPLVVAFGKQVTVLAVNSALLNVVANFLLLAAYAELTTAGPNRTNLIIPASDFVVTQTPQQTGSNSCPGQIPNCSNCGGNSVTQSDPDDTNGICVGLAQYNSYAAGCVCVDPNDSPPYQPYGTDSQSISEAFAFMTAVSANISFTEGPISTTTGGASSASGSMTIAASSSLSSNQACVNSGSYTTYATCTENCFSGGCSPVVVKLSRRDQPTHTVYHCACS